MAYRTVVMYMEIGCFVVCVSGWILVCSTMPTEIWTWSEVNSIALTTAHFFSNLWKDCVTDSTGLSDCKEIPSLLGLNWGIHMCRALVITSIILAFFGSILVLVGMKCTKIGGSEIANARVTFAGGMNYLIGDLGITPVKMVSNQTTPVYSPATHTPRTLCCRGSSVLSGRSLPKEPANRRHPRPVGVKCGRDGNVDHHMEMGKNLLAAGQLADALSHFHAAVDGDPNNYMAYYRRATVFLAMGKSKSALPDLSRVVELKPDFTSAQLQRGNLLLKHGRLDEAESDFKKVLKSNPSDKEEREAQSQLTKSDEIQRLVAQARSSFGSKDYVTAAAQLDTIIETCIWDVASREMRAECFIQMGEMGNAISDLKVASKLKSDNTQAFYKLSTIYYNLGDHEMSLNEVRECLKLDPDHKQCYSHYKQVKKLNKQIQSAEELIQEQRYEDAVSKYEAVIKTEPNVHLFSLLAKERICHALTQGQQASRAISVCSEVLQSDPENVDVLKDRAEAYIQDEQYEEAIKDYETAAKHSENDRQIKEGLERAQRLLKQSQKKDYYKILGVKRWALSAGF
ncbi:DnaJ -like protein subfamily C member 3 [Channa argus]|uniref:DnaJ-like protein subfamily C member 3 n=1 Tax=Channa argus TaxID=215402 RepID=A0A6G1PXY3_CHAAH|nr:DnaJ -like protein subfamily C member 3 [Channa argus]